MTTATTPTVTDWDGRPVVVGSRVRYFDAECEHHQGEVGTVIGFTDWDADVDDEGRGYSIAPEVLVRWDDGDEVHYGTTEWTERLVPDGDYAYREPDVGKVEELVVDEAASVVELGRQRDGLLKALQGIAAGPAREPRTGADWREACGEAVAVAQAALVELGLAR